MLAATIPAAVNVQAQDDDIYFSKKADKKAKQEAIYATTEEWSTSANSDWDLDDYNRRGKETTSPVLSDVMDIENAPFYYNVIDEKGDTIKVPGTKDMLKGADVNGYKIIRDTVVLVEQYHFSDLIRRFHNPYFGFYRYSPWYDVAYYDPFYWDYCYYDPWWYVTPSFGFHWGSWYGGWNFGYYSGWYGGWYSPFYHPYPHYYCYDHYYGPVYNYATGGSHRGSSRNNFGGHFAHRGGWKGDGGSSRLSSAGTNRSYRASNGARAGLASSNGTYTAGPTLRGRNTTNGRLANSNMRSSITEYNRSANNAGVSRGGDVSASGNGGTYSRSTHSATRYGSRSTADNSASRRAANSYTPSRSSSSNSTYSAPRSYDRSSNNSGSYSRGSYNSGSNTRSYSSGSSSSHSGGSFSSGGSYSGGGSRGGGSHSSGSSHGRR